MQQADQKEYNRLMQRMYRQKENDLKKLYQDNSVSGISFTEFKKQIKLTPLQKLSILLSDKELKINKLNIKLSDKVIMETLRRKKN